MVVVVVAWGGLVVVEIGSGGVGWFCGMFVGVGDLEGIDSVSICAGFRRSIDTVSLRPLIEMVKCLSVRVMTGYGPS